MANQYITTAKVAAMALEVLRNKVVFIKGMNRQYSEEFGQKGPRQIGYTVNARKPPRYSVGEGPVIDVQAKVQTYVPVTISHQRHVAVSAVSADYTLSEDEFRDNFIEPAMADLANDLDNLAIKELYPKVANFMAPAGGLGGIDNATLTAAQAITTIAQADQFLTEYAADERERVAVIAPRTNTALVTAYSSLFNPQDDGARRFKEGSIGRALNFEFGRDVNIKTFTNGTLNTTAAAGAAAQGGANTVQADATTPYTLVIAAPGATLKAGQVITLDGVFAVNPKARESLGRLQTFTVTEDVGAADTTMKILPYPVFKGAFKNVHSATDAIPANAVITSVSGVNSAAYTQNLFYHPDAFTMASARLWTPPNTDAKFMFDSASGLGIRFIRDYYDAINDTAISRLDVLVGFQAVYPELAVRVSG